MGTATSAIAQTGRTTATTGWTCSVPTLIQAGYTMPQIGRAIYLLCIESDNPHRSLYDNSRERDQGRGQRRGATPGLLGAQEATSRA